MLLKGSQDVNISLAVKRKINMLFGRGKIIVWEH
jgi:hypothetical protein